MKKLVIVGAGGLGRETAHLVNDINRSEETWQLIGFLDDNPTLTGQILNGIPVLGTTKQLLRGEFQDAYIAFAIGNSEIRKNVVRTIKGSCKQLRCATLIHPTAVISETTWVGQGSLIYAHTVITTNVTIGDHVIVSYGVTVGHDADLADFSTILPGTNISGNVKIGMAADIGAGSVLLPSVEVGACTIVGAGAVVTKHLPAHCTAVGVPAKPIKFLHAAQI